MKGDAMRPISQTFLAFHIDGKGPAVTLQHAIQRYQQKTGTRPGLVLCRPEHLDALAPAADGLVIQAPTTARGNPLVPPGLVYLGDGQPEEEATP
jgi:hypothetical protein